MKFSGVMIGSDNPKALGEFYTSVLGEPGYQGGTAYGWQTGTQLFIDSHSEISGSNVAPARIMLCTEVDDVLAEFKRLTELGAKVVAEPYHPGEDQTMWLATVADPDGNYLQIARPW